MRPAIIPPTIVTAVEFLMKKVLKFRRMIEDVGICLLRPATLITKIAEVITVANMAEVDLGHKIPVTLSLKIM